MKLNLTLACGLYDRTIALQNGSVSPEGIDLNYLMLGNSLTVSFVELFRRQARYAEFDVSEFSLSTYTILHAKGDRRMVAIPVFLCRKFRHADIYINKNAGIHEPKDLAGKRVGAMEYQQTAAVWIRGILEGDYGVQPSQIEWHFGGYNEPETYSERIPVTLPPNVRAKTISNQQCLDQMLECGEIDALIGAIPPRSLQAGSPNVARLFPNYQEVELDYYRRSDIFPIMHTVVIKREIYEKAPWVAMSLYKAFARSKAAGLRRLQFGGAPFCTLPWLGMHLEELRAQMGSDPFAYGVEENRHVLETFLRYSHDQGMISNPLTVDELFAPETHHGVEPVEV
ncbi:MAG: ABC transporter substrate-binding protein [Candidatus Binatia bacterium]